MVPVVIALFFAPTQNSCLIQQPALLRCSLIDLFPFRGGRMPGSISVPAARDSILQCSCRVLEQPLTLFAFCANIKPYLRFMMGPIHSRFHKL